jgi:membrane carboxypeptidase/penicillin-binding protein
MPTASQTLRLRRLRQAREDHRPWLKIGLVTAILVSLAAVVFVMQGIWYYVDLTRSLPSVEILPTLLDAPNGLMLEPTRIFDRDGEHVLVTLDNPAAQDAQTLTVSANGEPGTIEASKFLVDATITELDPDFWDSPGFTLAGITEGTHPTVAQILVSSLLLDGEPPSYTRNIRERLLAAQVTAQYGREKVLEWYLNSAQYGETLFGADAAARVYFGKSAAELSVAEAAMLTAIAEKPSLNPLTGSQILAKQQEIIIQKMFVSGLITGDETLGALVEDVHFQSQVVSTNLAPAFTAQVLKQLSSKIPLERLYRGGYNIVTTLDYNLQLQVDCASKVQIARLGGSQESTLTFDGSPCEAGSLLPNLPEGTGNLPNNLGVEIVVLEPHTGQIVAMVGEDGSGISPSSPAEHPAGTILSPFMYLAAFSRGMTPATMLWDIPAENSMESPEPGNIDMISNTTNMYHGPVSLRRALINDYQGAANEVLQQLGLATVVLTEKQFGLDTTGLIPETGADIDSMSSQSVSLLNSVKAYSVLANQGIMAGQPDIDNSDVTGQVEINPSSVLKVESLDGQVLQNWTIPDMLPIVTRQIAYLTTNVLSDDKARQHILANPNSLDISRPVAVKLSVTADGNNTWTVGYIPQMAFGVWIGDSEGETGGITSDAAAGLWHAIVQYASSGMPVQEFTLPPEVSLMQVCYPSGLRVSSLCPAIVQEAFLSGTEPTQVDNLYQKVAINRETGLLATVFTPPEMVEYKVFLTVPPQAQAWAKESGMEIPPVTYDYIVSPQPSTSDVKISAPQMFDHVSGVVNLTGTADCADFSYYRIQVGQGLNPQKWLQIGQDVKSPVIDGTLGTWDTSGLQGLYVVQLQVISQDSRVDQAILQLTVDNTPPVVQILSPRMDEQFSYQPGITILMAISAIDNLVVERVEFYVDDTLEKTLQGQPYAIVWDASPGEHTLRVKVFDLAGNQSESKVSFTVSK